MNVTSTDVLSVPAHDHGIFEAPVLSGRAPGSGLLETKVMF